MCGRSMRGGEGVGPKLNIGRKGEICLFSKEWLTVPHLAAVIIKIIITLYHFP